MPPPQAAERKMKKQPNKSKAKNQQFPPGWDEERVRQVREHYESQTEEGAVAEDEAAIAVEGHSVMVVPTELVPEIRKLIAKRRGA
jgi:hypothetical protein